MKTTIIAAALLVAASVAPALASDACLMKHDVEGWGMRKDHTLVVNDRFGHKYLLSVAGMCNDLNFSMGLGIRSPGGNFGDFCVDRGDRIVLGGPGVIDHHPVCMITKVERYTPDMEKAYKAAREAEHHS